MKTKTKKQKDHKQDPLYATLMRELEHENHRIAVAAIREVITQRPELMLKAFEKNIYTAYAELVKNSDKDQGTVVKHCLNLLKAEINFAALKRLIAESGLGLSMTVRDG